MFAAQFRKHYEMFAVQFRKNNEQMDFVKKAEAILCSFMMMESSNWMLPIELQCILFEYLIQIRIADIILGEEEYKMTALRNEFVSLSNRTQFHSKIVYDFMTGERFKSILWCYHDVLFEDAFCDVRRELDAENIRYYIHFYKRYLISELELIVNFAEENMHQLDQPDWVGLKKMILTYALIADNIYKINLTVLREALPVFVYIELRYAVSLIIDVREKNKISSVYCNNVPGNLSGLQLNDLPKISSISNVTFSKVDFSNQDVSHILFDRCRFIQSRLSGAVIKLASSCVTEVDLSNAKVICSGYNEFLQTNISNCLFESSRGMVAQEFNFNGSFDSIAKYKHGGSLRGCIEFLPHERVHSHREINYFMIHVCCVLFSGLGGSAYKGRLRSIVVFDLETDSDFDVDGDLFGPMLEAQAACLVFIQSILKNLDCPVEETWNEFKTKQFRYSIRQSYETEKFSLFDFLNRPNISPVIHCGAYIKTSINYAWSFFSSAKLFTLTKKDFQSDEVNFLEEMMEKAMEYAKEPKKENKI